MIPDFGSFTRRESMLYRVHPAETWGGDKAWKRQRVKDQKEGGRRQKPWTCLRSRSDRPTDSASSWEIPITVKALVSTASS